MSERLEFLKERREAISAERDKGRSYAAIGRDFGISGVRVNQICAKVSRQRDSALKLRGRSAIVGRLIALCDSIATPHLHR